MISGPKAVQVQDTSAINAIGTLILSTLVIVCLGVTFNAHSQETQPQVYDRIAIIMSMPVQTRCDIIGRFAGQGAEGRRQGITAQDVLDHDEARELENNPDYRLMSEAEVEFRLAYTQDGWDVANTWAEENTAYLSENDNIIPEEIVYEIHGLVFQACMTYGVPR